MKKLLILLLLLAPLGCGAKEDGNGGEDGGANAMTITGDEGYTAEIVKISVPGMV